MIGHAPTRRAPLAAECRTGHALAPLTRPFAILEPTLHAVLAGRCTEVRRPAGPSLRALRPGDRLWLREPFHLALKFDSWAPLAAATVGACPTFAADMGEVCPGEGRGRRRFARELPKAWHRAHLIVTAIRREFLQAIPEAAIRAEGFKDRATYACAWDRNLGYFSRSPDQVKPGSWATDPTVLVIAFDFIPEPLR